MEAVQDGELCGFGMSFARKAIGAQNFLHEMLVRVFWQMLAWLNASRLPLRRIDFSFPEPAYAAIYPMVFPAPIRFGQPRTAAWFDATALQAPVRRDEEALRAIERLITTVTPVSQLAVQLGFADATAFNRAFKVWTRSTPGTYRRR